MSCCRAGMVVLTCAYAAKDMVSLQMDTQEQHQKAQTLDVLVMGG